MYWSSLVKVQRRLDDDIGAGLLEPLEYSSNQNTVQFSCQATSHCHISDCSSAITWAASSEVAYIFNVPGYGQPGYGGQPQGGGLEMGHGPYPSVGDSGNIAPQVQQWFRAVDKDQSGQISAIELKSALVNAQGKTFSETACNLMIGMFDKDRSGHINLEEFDKLYTYINQWLAVFKTYDTDQSGHIDEQELSKALSQMGFKFSPDFINFLAKRSDTKDGKISVDQFIVLCVQIQRFTEAFRVRDTQQNGTVTIGFEDFLNVALSCSI
ncbi:hypothetical protein evm_000641 [Chilo suppressalis]|nr:hypothetical protein evm_000641 [Chilo suppressalis]